MPHAHHRPIAQRQGEMFPSRSRWLARPQWELGRTALLCRWLPSLAPHSLAAPGAAWAAVDAPSIGHRQQTHLAFKEYTNTSWSHGAVLLRGQGHVGQYAVEPWGRDHGSRASGDWEPDPGTAKLCGRDHHANVGKRDP